MTRRAGVTIAVALGGCLAATGCSGTGRPRAAVAARNVPADWHRVATRADATRLHDWRDAFVKGLNAARLGGAAARVAGEGALLEPDAALDQPQLAAGRYRCRTIKLGSQGSGPAFATYPAFDCIVADEGEVSSFAKLTGSQRPVGLIFAADSRRQIFLGTLMLGDEKTALEYGRDPDRDMAGAIERIGERRWRLVLPYPRFESIVDVVELVPAA